ncbi:hypothetical protein ES708_22485 [subsurface metagenome]
MSAIFPVVRSYGLRGPTAEEVMVANRGIAPGFDFVRVALSLVVILLHSFHTAYGLAPMVVLATNWSAPLWGATLPIFFALSGFLVTGSALHSRSLSIFLGLRVLRIVPALAVEISLSALILGPLLTVIPIKDYFSDRQFITYFFNIFGWIHYQLPGVFTSNPLANVVNLSLWTLHPELLSYVVMTVLMISGLAYRRGPLTAVWIVMTTMLMAYNAWTGRFDLAGVYKGPVLIYYFFTGVVAYHWRNIIVLNKVLFCVAVIMSYVLLRIASSTFILLPFTLTYIMVFMGMRRLPLPSALKSGDYSYGLYLYAFPVQQAIVQFAPWAREWWIVFPLATIATYVIARLSWHLIEKPILRFKPLLTNRGGRAARV